MHFQTATAIFAHLALVALSTALPADIAEENTLVKRIDHYGEATVYTQQGGTGSCGQTHSDGAKIVALSNYWMKDQSPGPYCGRKVKVTNTGSDDGAVHGKGNTIIATVEDTCPGCDENHIDFSVGSWNELTNSSPFSVANIEWHFCNADGNC